MKRIVKISSLFILTLLFSCYEKDVYPDIPRISFDDIVFYAGEFTDSLVLSFEFEDGGGDIGLNSDVSPPYHIFDGIIDDNDQFVFINTHPDSLAAPFYSVPLEAKVFEDELEYVYYPELANKFSDEDLRTPYNCDDYFIIDTDTLFVDRNVFTNNIYIVFERKVGSSNGDFFEKVEIPYPDCEAPRFDSRIPFFEVGAQKGVIKYNIQSLVLKTTFPDDILRIKFWVYDRAFNQSNIEYTKEFTLSGITQ